MKLLFDTHSFIWWAESPEKLAPATFAALSDSRNTRLLSVASVWEMQIKRQLGKLQLEVELKDLIETQLVASNIQLLPVELTHVLELDNLPFQHKDPFDRLLIAQANAERATLVTADPKFAAYSVGIL